MRPWHSAAITVQQPPLVLWYERPATVWESEALPLGNGFIGAMVFGGVERTDQINEKTLWSGGPGANVDYDGGHSTSGLMSFVNTWPQPGGFCRRMWTIFQESGGIYPSAYGASGIKGLIRNEP